MEEVEDSEVEKKFDIIATTCNTHIDEKVSAFCKKHRETLCLRCLLSNHSQCVAEEKVQDIKTTLEESGQIITNITDSSEKVSATLSGFKEKNKERFAVLEASEDKMNDTIEKLRISLIEQIEKLSVESLEMVKSVVEAQRDVITHDEEVIQSFVDELEKIRTAIEEMNGKDSVNISDIKSLEGRFLELEEKINGMGNYEKNTKLSFKISEELFYVRNYFSSLGELCFNRENDLLSDISIVQSRRIDQLVKDYSSRRRAKSCALIMPTRPSSHHPRDNAYDNIDISNASQLSPPLPGAHPASAIRERFLGRPRTQSMPKPVTIKEEIEQRPVSPSLTPMKYSERPRLEIPKLPKRRDDRKSSSDAVDNNSAENYNNDELKEQMPTAKVSEDVTNLYKHPVSRAVDNNDAVDLRKNDQTDESAKEIKRSDWQIESFSSSETEIPPVKDSSVLEPPKSHVFMWSSSSSGASKPKSPKQPRAHGGNNVIQKPSPLAIHNPYFSSETVTTISSADNSKFYISDLDDGYIEPLKALSHSDVSELKDVKYEKRLVRTSSENSVDWDRYDEEDIVRDFRGSPDDHSPYINQSPSPDTVSCYSNASAFTNTSLQSSYKNLVQQRSPYAGSTASLTPKFVIKEKKSDDCQNFKLPDVKDATGRHGRSHHCTFTGIAITSSGHLLVCDYENHSVEHFNSEGILVGDYTDLLPFSCCGVRDEIIAVTSRSKKTVAVIEVSKTAVKIRKELKVGLVTDVFGIAHCDGYFAVCCRDQVTMLYEDLRPYCEVKPLMITTKKHSKPYFRDVRYAAIDQRGKIRLYTSEHNVNRVTFISVDKTLHFRKEWECRVAKPRSVLIHEDCLLVAGKGKIVILSCSNGEHLRDIRNDVPSHPVHMILYNNWLYMTKSSTTSAESRIIRKIHL